MGYHRLYFTQFEFGGDSVVPSSSRAIANT
jgi:hypothetical protein